MRLGKDLQNKPVYSVTDGRLLGTVKDIYLNSPLDQINGIYLGSEGIIKRKHFLISTEQIVVFGLDAILVRDNDVVVHEGDLPETAAWVRLSKLRGRQIDTTGGTKVASLGDIILDDRGVVTAYALSRVYVEGPIANSGRIARPAVVDTGNEDGLMTIDLAMAENPPELKEAGEEVATAVPEPEPTPEPPAAEDSEAAIDPPTEPDDAPAKDDIAYEEPE